MPGRYVGAAEPFLAVSVSSPVPVFAAAVEPQVGPTTGRCRGTSMNLFILMVNYQGIFFFRRAKKLKKYHSTVITMKWISRWIATIRSTTPLIRSTQG